MLRVGPHLSGQGIQHLKDVGQLLRVVVGGDELCDLFLELVAQPGAVLLGGGRVDLEAKSLWIPENAPEETGYFRAASSDWQQRVVQEAVRRSLAPRPCSTRTRDLLLRRRPALTGMLSE